MKNTYRTSVGPVHENKNIAVGGLPALLSLQLARAITQQCLAFIGPPGTTTVCWTKLNTNDKKTSPKTDLPFKNDQNCFFSNQSGRNLKQNATL